MAARKTLSHKIKPSVRQVRGESKDREFDQLLRRASTLFSAPAARHSRDFRGKRGAV
jgi:hypothetical protein